MDGAGRKDHLGKGAIPLNSAVVSVSDSKTGIAHCAENRWIEIGCSAMSQKAWVKKTDQAAKTRYPPS